MTDTDECFEEYKKEFLLKQFVAVNITMVAENMRTPLTAFIRIREKYEELFDK